MDPREKQSLLLVLTIQTLGVAINAAFAIILTTIIIFYFNLEFNLLSLLLYFVIYFLLPFGRLATKFHVYWNKRASREIVLETDDIDSLSADIEHDATVEQETEPQTQTDPWDQLDRAKLASHFLFWLSPSTWRWLLRNPRSHLVIPLLKPFDFAGRATARDIDTVAYSWFLIILLLGLITGSVFYVLDIDAEQYLIASGFILAFGLYPTILILEVADFFWPYSTQFILLFIAVLGLGSVFLGSFAIAMVTFGMLFWAAVAGGIELRFKGGKLDYNFFPYGGMIFLILAGFGSFFSFSTVAQGIYIRIAVSVVLGAFFLGNILSELLPKNAEQRTTAVTGVYMLSWALASFVIVPAFINALGLLEVAIMLISFGMALSASNKGKLSALNRDSKVQRPYLFSFTFPYPVTAIIPIQTALMHLLLFGTLPVIIYLSLLLNASAIERILGIIAVASIPVFVYDLAFYSVVLVAFGVQWLSLKYKLEHRAGEDSLSSWKRTIPYHIQALQWPLPFLPSLIIEIANQHGLLTALNELDRYAKGAMEGRTVVRTFRSLAKEGYGVYMIFCWALSNGLIPQLIHFGKDNPVAKEAVRLLVVLDLLEKDPYIKKNFIKIRAKGQDYYIASSEGISLQSITNEATRNIKQYANEEDRKFFSCILRIISICLESQNIGQLQKAAPDFENVFTSHPYLPHEEELRDPLIQLSHQLREMVSRYPVDTQQRLYSRDRELLYDSLHWLKMQEASIQKSFVGLLTFFILNRIDKIRA